MKYVYILESHDSLHFYVGITADLPARLSKHNAGCGSAKGVIGFARRNHFQHAVSSGEGSIIVMKIETILGAVILLAAMSIHAMAAEQAAKQAAAPVKSLYERLGGLKGITVVVDDFIDRMVADEALNSNPAIDAGRKSSPAPYLKFQVSQMVCQVTGGPCSYTGLSMKDSHATMGVTEADWEIMVGLFKQSLAKFQVPAAEQTDILVVVSSTKDDIVMAVPAKP